MSLLFQQIERAFSFNFHQHLFVCSFGLSVGKKWLCFLIYIRMYTRGIGFNVTCINRKGKAMESYKRAEFQTQSYLRGRGKILHWSFHNMLHITPDVINGVSSKHCIRTPASPEEPRHHLSWYSPHHKGALNLGEKKGVGNIGFQWSNSVVGHLFAFWNTVSDPQASFPTFPRLLENLSTPLVFRGKALTSLTPQESLLVLLLPGVSAGCLHLNKVESPSESMRIWHVRKSVIFAEFKSQVTHENGLS